MKNRCFCPFLQDYFFFRRNADEQSTVSIPVVNNKFKRSTIHLEIQYIHGFTVIFEICGSKLSEDELVDMYQSKICDDSLFISLATDDKQVIVEKDKVAQFSIRKGSGN